MMLMLRRKKRAKLPNLLLGPEFFEQMGKAAVGSFVENVEAQREPGGGAIKSNAPSTRARKRREGKPPMSLVDQQKRFVRAAGYIVTPIKNGVRITPKAQDIARALVAKGYHWMGISKDLQAAIRALLRAHIKAAFRRAAK